MKRIKKDTIFNGRATRTDLASELTAHRIKRFDEYVTRTDVVVDAVISRKIGKPEGVYTTIESPVVQTGDRENYDRLTDALTSALKEYTKMCDNCLVVGLGNPSMTADALGDYVVKRINVTRGDKEEGCKRGISTICPNVLGVTGIDSFDIVKGVTERIAPDLIIAVDSLCASATERIAAAFQICSAGITPGSGVSNFRYRLDEHSLGVKVVSVGVPLVVYATTIIKEAVKVPTSLDDRFSEMIVTPKDIDIIAEDCAEIIAAAINNSLGC